ncbi:putative mobile element trasfer protein [Streptomyces bingchenggensis BCW-1]|uniref:Putative mobile element trasfer protein n=1 Tax=Streptomyces bingchenggensis (strain BCW-1) TaxID=749414 RepID=D7BW11_STRBB|nr:MULTISPECIES: Pycsar system effector family protein [Streptomyces]ADI09740.1 putative mobile element trasfer protein [Streptomyces bingchenggensis BCW-1]
MSTIEQNLTAAHAEVKAEIARTDSKTSLLLAFIGALLAGVWTVANDAHLPAPAYAVGGTGVALLVTAAALLLRAVRPNLGGARPMGFPLWATLSAEQIRATLAEDRREQDIANLSRIAVAKFANLRRAVDLTCVAGVLLLVAAGIAAGGAL